MLNYLARSSILCKSCKFLFTILICMCVVKQALIQCIWSPLESSQCSKSGRKLIGGHHAIISGGPKPRSMMSFLTWSGTASIHAEIVVFLTQNVAKTIHNLTSQKAVSCKLTVYGNFWSRPRDQLRCCMAHLTYLLTYLLTSYISVNVALAKVSD